MLIFPIRPTMGQLSRVKSGHGKQMILPKTGIKVMCYASLVLCNYRQLRAVASIDVWLSGANSYEMFSLDVRTAANSCISIYYYFVFEYNNILNGCQIPRRDPVDAWSQGPLPPTPPHLLHSTGSAHDEYTSVFECLYNVVMSLTLYRFPWNSSSSIFKRMSRYCIVPKPRQLRVFYSV